MSTTSGSNNHNLAARELSSAVLTGTVIGRSLIEALHSLRQEDEGYRTTKPVDDNDNDDGGVEDEEDQTTSSFQKKDEKNSVRMDTKSMDRIIKSFGEAVAETDQDSAPRALLRGRCDYYNKFGQNWMISVDQVRIKSRPTKFTKRRRNDRPSLWDRDDDGTAKTTTTEKEIPVKGKIQLLAYGDLI